jgi:hypothetical protein
MRMHRSFLNHCFQCFKYSLLAGIFLHLQAHAAPANPDFVLYEIKSGDTLSNIVNRHTQGEDALRQLITANALQDINRIPIGFQLKIPRPLIKYTLSKAVVTQSNCKTVRKIAADQAHSIQIGSVLQEGDVVQVPPDCQLGLQLDDGSTLRLVSGAVIKITTLRRNTFQTSPEVQFELLDGRAELKVIRKRLGTDAPFQILTPTAVAGVRGTEFRVGFDAQQRHSQVEVLTGAVGARGSTDPLETGVETGQGLPITATGQSLPVEKLLAPPDYERHEAQSGGQDWLIHFKSDPLAKQFVLNTAADAGFSADFKTRPSAQSQVLVPKLGAQALFTRWASVSQTGLVGATQDHAFCKGYKRQDQWRCDLTFTLSELTKPHLVIQKLEANGQVIEILSGQVFSAQGKPFVIPGWISGTYRWRIDYEVSEVGKVFKEGQFKLTAIPGNAP